MRNTRKENHTSSQSAANNGRPNLFFDSSKERLNVGRLVFLAVELVR